MTGQRPKRRCKVCHCRLDGQAVRVANVTYSTDTTGALRFWLCLDCARKIEKVLERAS